MSDHITTGSTGEQVAYEYLLGLGYSVVDRNFRTPFGEIDIIAHDPDGTLVIVEVKTTRAYRIVLPEDNLTRSKLFKLSRISLFYANKHPTFISPLYGFRIDLIAIILDPPIGHPALCEIGNSSFAISHYKNISL